VEEHSTSNHEIEDLNSLTWAWRYL